MKLTTSTIKIITLPAGKTDHTFFDDDVGGFGLRVRASGARSFILQYDYAGRTRRMKLGGVGELDIGKARSTAKDSACRRAPRPRPGGREGRCPQAGGGSCSGDVRR